MLIIINVKNSNIKWIKLDVFVVISLTLANYFVQINVGIKRVILFYVAVIDVFFHLIAK